MTHILKEKLISYSKDKLDEVSEQAIKNHIDECDECFEMYLALSEQMVDNDGAFEAGETAALISDKLNKKQRKLAFNVFRSYTTAASLTLVFLWSGAFDKMVEQLPQVGIAIGNMSAEMLLAADKLGRLFSALI